MQLVGQLRGCGREHYRSSLPTQSRTARAAPSSSTWAENLLMFVGLAIAKGYRSVEVTFSIQAFGYDVFGGSSTPYSEPPPAKVDPLRAKPHATEVS
jgi:hypothetical protein